MIHVMEGSRLFVRWTKSFDAQREPFDNRYLPVI